MPPGDWWQDKPIMKKKKRKTNKEGHKTAVNRFNYKTEGHSPKR